MKSIILSIALFAICFFASQGQTTTISYNSTNTVIANPERGWYDDYYSHYVNQGELGSFYVYVDSTQLVNNREKDKITLILRLFYLHEFLEEESVNEEYLAKMQTDFNTMRYAGVKCIVRFAYSGSDAAEVWDATPDKVYSHIESLSEILHKNGDVIAGVQAGFIGAWGEWYYTKNFAQPNYQPNDTDQENRRILVDKLLEALPEHITVQGRTPAIMRNILESEEPLTEVNAFDGSKLSRIGHHNDCFLANSSDYGTFTNLEDDLAYLHETTKYTITGGETCDASNDYSGCKNALERIQLLHWTYLNRDYNISVYNKWKNQGCYDEINIALGYRLALKSVTLADSVSAGDDFAFTMEFENNGYAAPTQYKPVQLVFINTESKNTYAIQYKGENDDIRFWLPGNISIKGSVNIPDSLPEGNYSVALRFPDQDPGLAERAEYSIQLANPGIWNKEKGINELSHIVVVGNGGVGELPEVPNLLEGTALSETEIELTWINATENTGYEIMRSKKDDNKWELLVTLGADESNFVDSELDKGTIYSYIIRSINDFGHSAWSNAIDVTTLGVSVIFNNINKIKIYPNPLGNDDLKCRFSQDGDKQVVVTDLSGKIIFQHYTTDSELKINRTLFKQGMYIVNVTNKTGVNISKLLVY